MTTYAGGGDPAREMSAILQQGNNLVIHGTHVITSTILARVTDPIVEFAHTGKLILAAGASFPLMDLSPPTPFTGAARVYGWCGDCSQGIKIGGAASSSGLILSRYASFEVDVFEHDGGSWEASDSGFVPFGNVHGSIKNGLIKNCGDLGIYATGIYTSPDQPLVPHPETLTIEDMTFKNCHGGIDVKRRLKGPVIVRDCDFVDCAGGVRMSWVGNVHGAVDGPDTPPGMSARVIRGLFKRCRVGVRPEALATLHLQNPTFDQCEDAIAINQGATLSGKCFVNRGTRRVVDQSFTSNGNTYEPTTTLTVREA